MAGTKPLDCMGVNAWELSVMLENFSCSWISDKLYRKPRTYAAVSPATALSCGDACASTTRAEASR